jgi:hypothetical protein
MDVREIPPLDTPDEFTQVDRPEIDTTTPHPEPGSPQAKKKTDETGFPVTKETIGFRPPKI